jgi:hypothetical protein
MSCFKLHDYAYESKEKEKQNKKVMGGWPLFHYNNEHGQGMREIFGLDIKVLTCVL